MRPVGDGYESRVVHGKIRSSLVIASLRLIQTFSEAMTYDVWVASDYECPFALRSMPRGDEFTWADE